jgi:hypothetical protein
VNAAGVDIGRVLIAGDGADTSFLGSSEETAMRAPEIPGAFDAVAALVEALHGKVYLVSKCGPRIEARTRRWLVLKRFFDRTGMSRDNLRFCRERRDKVAIAQALKLDRFVDDRADVLRPMRGVLPLLVLFGARTAEEGLIAAPDWRSALPVLIAGPRGP